jgi:hypothetical protein
MTMIRVPRPSKDAFNPKRMLARNTLLLNQVKHFHALEMELPPAQRTGIDFESIQTEGDAAKYIRAMTHILHPRAAGSGK